MDERYVIQMTAHEDEGDVITYVPLENPVSYEEALASQHEARRLAEAGSFDVTGSVEELCIASGDGQPLFVYRVLNAEDFRVKAALAAKKLDPKQFTARERLVYEFGQKTGREAESQQWDNAMRYGLNSVDESEERMGHPRRAVEEFAPPASNALAWMSVLKGLCHMLLRAEREVASAAVKPAMTH